jgi:LAGLIDADG-like domain
MSKKDSFGGFLSDLEGRLIDSVQDSHQRRVLDTDSDEKRLFTRAPNAIEWCIDKKYQNVPSIFHHVRQYQIIRDFFQLRCPLPSCNTQTDAARDAWGKGREYLESENLLAWNNTLRDDVCPSCRTTRSEFYKDGLVKLMNQLHIISGMRSLSLDSHVLTSAGLTRVGDLLPPKPDTSVDYELSDMKVFGSGGWEPVTHAYYHGDLPSKLVRLRNKMEMTISHTHPLYGFNNGVWGWHRANTISTGAYVECVVNDAWPGRNNNFSEATKNKIKDIKYAGRVSYTTPQEFTPQLSSLLGYLMAEGSVNGRKHAGFTNGDQCTLDHFEELCINLFNYQPRYEFDTKSHLGQTNAIISHSGIREFLLCIGLGCSVAKTKTLPEPLWNVSEECISAYLRSYFEGDGTAAVEKESRKPTVACYTVSKQLALDTQQILWNLGIDASIFVSKSRAYGTGGKQFDHDAYSIRIYGNNILKFADKIGFTSRRKMRALDECVDLVKRTSCQQHKIPGVGHIIKEIHDKVPVPNSLYHAIRNVESGKYDAVSHGTLLEFIQHVDNHINCHEEFELMTGITRLGALRFFNKITVGSEYRALVDIYKSMGEARRTSLAAPIVRSISEKIEFGSKSGLSDTISHINSGRYSAMSKPRLKQIIDFVGNHIDSSEAHSIHASLLGGAFDVSRIREYLLTKTFDVSLLDQLKRLSNPWSRFVMVDSVSDGPAVPMADLHVPGTNSFVSNSIMNHNSGKTSTAGLMGTYMEHILSVIAQTHQGGLAGYWNQMPNQDFEVTFIASTDVQSQDTVWAKYTALRQGSPWIQKYIKWIKQKELEQPVINGARPWAYEELQKYISNGLLNVKYNSLNSSSGGMAGRTRIGAFIDELARFENTDSARSADEAYRVLENSLRTVRGKAEDMRETPWLGTMISISSPISFDDKAMRLLRDAPKIKNMYYGHWATWEFNPDLPRSKFDDAFEKDPIGAQRDFGANPPMAASPLIGDVDRFREMAIQKDLEPTAQFQAYIHVDRTGREYIASKSNSAKILRDGERYICADAGATFDQFAVACAHGEWVQSQSGRQLVTVYDWVFRMLPEAKPKRDVWFDSIVQVVEYLSKFYFIARVEFDRWQSSYLIQQIRDRGIDCKMESTTSDDYIKFLNDVNFSRVRMLPPALDDHAKEPIYMTAPGLAFYELERLERTADLKRVFNPRKGNKRGFDSDDVATVVAHVNKMVQSSVIDLSLANGRTARFKRESTGGHGWSGRGSIFKVPNNKRGW